MAKKTLKKDVVVSIDLSPEQIVLRDALPEVFRETKGALIAQVLDLAVHQVAQAEEFVAKLTIMDEASAARAADAAVLFKKSSADLEAKRKAQTDPVKKAANMLKALFDTPKNRLDLATSAVLLKLSTWRRAEQARLDEIAAKQRAEAQAEAIRQAEASIAMGDEAGAQTLLEDVQNISMDAPVATVTGNYGSSFSVAKRKVGTVTDRFAFLEWLITAGRFGDPRAIEMVNALDFGAQRCNQLAAAILDEKKPTPPGFKAELVDSDRLR